MVSLVALLETAEDRDRLRHRRFADEDRLEAALEGSVLLDALPILVERGRADQPKLAAGEHRLQHVRGVDSALGRTRSDNRVELVDEEDDLPLGCLDLVQDGLEPLLELAPVLRPGEQRADVEGPHALALQPFGNVAGDDALSEALDDGRLADTGLADQDRVVLRPAREHLDDSPNFLVAADHRIELALLRLGGQVAAELLERLVRALGILRGDPLAAAYFLQRLLELFPREEIQGQQHVLGRDEVVLELLHLLLGLVEDPRESGGGARLLGGGPLDGRLGGQRRLGLRPQVGDRASRTLDERLRQLLVEEREDQVLRIHLRVALSQCLVHRRGHGFLRLECQLVEVHLAFLSGSVSLAR